jgi:pimeloyl-ACP methyl ester carboxylesterase
MQMEVASAASVEASDYWAGGSAPILEIIPDADPFKPHAYWHELRGQLGDRVTAEVVADASHALFPEQPDRVIDVVVTWCRRLIAQ